MTRSNHCDLKRLKKTLNDMNLIKIQSISIKVLFYSLSLDFSFFSRFISNSLLVPKSTVPFLTNNSAFIWLCLNHRFFLSIDVTITFWHHISKNDSVSKKKRKKKKVAQYTPNLCFRLSIKTKPWAQIYSDLLLYPQTTHTSSFQTVK